MVDLWHVDSFWLKSKVDRSINLSCFLCLYNQQRGETGHLVIKLWEYFIMSDPEKKDDGEISTNIKMILFVIGCVIIWIVLQSVIGVPMKM